MGATPSTPQSAGTWSSLSGPSGSAAYSYATLPPKEPWSNKPIYWDAAPGIGGSRNYLSKVLADPVPLPVGLQFSQLGKGFIISPPVKTSDGQSTHLQCFFKYNPNQYDYSYEFDMSSIGATPPTFTNGTQIRGLALNATLTIELFFERIQDLWIGYGNTAVPNLAAKFGVLWDIWAVERLCGVYGQSTGQDPSGPPVTQPMTLWMGGVGNSRAFNMSGLITGLDVNVTQFDSNMVPAMATVSLNIVRVLNPNANITNGSPVGKPIAVTSNAPSATNIGKRGLS